MAGLPHDIFQRLLATVKGETTASVPVGKTRSATVDLADLSLVSAYHWVFNGRYAYARVPGGKFVLMHRLIVGDDDTECVDHIDGDGLNNQRYNLRPATRKENSRNRNSVSGRSKFKGVTRDTKTQRWRAKITVDGKIIRLGGFKSERLAAKAYDAAAEDLHGEFAKTNAQLGLY